MSHQLAQLNIAKFIKPIDDPVNTDFVANLDSVNKIAENSAGFIWRLKSDESSETSQNDSTNQAILLDNDPNIAINMSVWQDINSLMQFTYANKAHVALMKRRKEWFSKLDFHLVLWWIPTGHEPSLAEAMERLNYLRDNGSTAHAFTFSKAFDASGLPYTKKPAKCG